jgi:DGQHR domain-containing protein
MKGLLAMSNETLVVPGFELQVAPKILLSGLPGKWLLQRTTPTWRIDDPEKGFQRVVREKRAREIAVAVLDQRRTFPNAIVLATDRIDFEISNGSLHVPEDVKFLVVDGQHRLWAQKFSDFEAEFACVIHVGLSEVEMARLFLEINDNQKRVPSSLRWDLVRLVRPEDDPATIAAAEMVYSLSTELESPLFQRIDLTGEQSEITLKQGSLAPGLRSLLTSRSPLHELSFDDQYQIILQYFIALRELDPDTWGTEKSQIYKARVIRAALRLLLDIVRSEDKSPQDLISEDFRRYLDRIDPGSLDYERIKAVQGNAGISAIYHELHNQVFQE